jgi:hypothetical protein
VASLLSMAGLIACKDVSLFHGFLCSWHPPPMFYKLLEIERPVLPYGEVGEPPSVEGARSHTLPTAFCFEFYTMNTGEPEGDVKEGGE